MIVFKPNKCTFFTKQILGLVAILFLVSCNSDKPQKLPKYLISQEMMSQILADIKIIDAAYQAGIGPSSLDSNTLDSAKLDSINVVINESNPKITLYEKVKAKILENDSSLKRQNTIQNDSLNSDIDYEPVDYAPPVNENIFRSHLGADYDFVFKKYKVTRENFDKSMDYYTQKPEIFFLITERALSILSEYLIQVKPVVPDSTAIQEVVK